MWQLARRHPLALAVGALLAVDWAFIGIQVAVDATDYEFTGAYRLSLETEQGVAQADGWVQAALASFLLFQAWRHYWSPAAGFWAAILAYLTFDDAFTLHEVAGRYLAETFAFGEIGPLRGEDVGEAIVSLA